MERSGGREQGRKKIVGRGDFEEDITQRGGREVEERKGEVGDGS